MSTFYRVTDNQLMYGQVIQNVVHFKHASSDPATMDALMLEFRDTWVAQMRVMQSSAILHTTLNCQMLESQFAPRSLALSLAGNNSFSNEYKLYQCHIVRLRSATIGRHGRGRVYIAGIAFNLAQNGIITAANITTWNARLANIMAVFGPGGSSAFDLVILPRGNPQAAVDVVNMSMNPVEGVQRRRNVGVGI